MEGPLGHRWLIRHFGDIHCRQGRHISIFVIGPSNLKYAGRDRIVVARNIELQNVRTILDISLSSSSFQGIVRIRSSDPARTLEVTRQLSIQSCPSSLLLRENEIVCLKLYCLGLLIVILLVSVFRTPKSSFATSKKIFSSFRNDVRASSS